MPTNNPLQAEAIENSMTYLTKSLNLLLWLQLVAKTSHWNIRGILFLPQHRLYDEIFDIAVKGTDLVAERIAQLGEVVVPETTSLPEELTTVNDIPTHMTQMVSALSDVSQQLREGAKGTEDSDPFTADTLIEIGRDIDKMLWFMESHIPQKVT